MEVLQSKGVKLLYHANTVATSCTFLSHATLMARGVVAESGLHQTTQFTDHLDKRYGIWHDLFFDVVDIHDRKHDINLYGPVLFAFDIQVLTEDWLTSVLVTKKNPSRWSDGEQDSERYFATVDEFEADYKIGDFGSMILIRSSEGKLSLKEHLKLVSLDDPMRREGSVELYSYALGALTLASRLGGIKDVKPKRRVCRDICKCKGSYGKIDVYELGRLFAP